MNKSNMSEWLICYPCSQTLIEQVLSKFLKEKEIINWLYILCNLVLLFSNKRPRRWPIYGNLRACFLSSFQQTELILASEQEA